MQVTELTHIFSPPSPVAPHELPLALVNSDVEDQNPVYQLQNGKYSNFHIRPNAIQLQTWQFQKVINLDVLYG